MDPYVIIEFSTGEDALKMGHWEGAKVRDILEEFAEDGRKGDLFRQDIRLMRNVLLVSGETYVFVEKRPKYEEAWMSTQAKMPSASVVAKSVPQIIKYLGAADPVYDVGRISGIMPLPVAHEAFARYVELFRTLVPTAVDWANVINMFEMSEFYEDDEKQRHITVFAHLTSYLRAACPNLEFQFKFAADSGKGSVEEMDMVVMVKIGEFWLVLMEVEVKNEIGFGGESCIEALKYYGDYVNDAVRGDGTIDDKRWMYYYSCVPILIMEVVGTTIRVGGAICHDRPGYEPLTPYLHLLKYVQDLEHRNRVARAIAAIPRTLEVLATFYKGIAPGTGTNTRTKRDESVTWPYYVRKEREEDPGLQVIKFRRRLDRTTLHQMFRGRDEQLLYLLKYSHGERKIVKFCQRYGTEVHRKWQDAGLAPNFTVTELSGDWKVIRMDVYSPEDGWMVVSSLDPAEAENVRDGTALDPALWDACKKAVLKAYEQLQSLYPGHVHGDLRKSNILHNRDSSGVMFIDFDWAGLENEVRYPPFLNPHITWPNGVKSGELILSTHDAALLRADLGI